MSHENNQNKVNIALKFFWQWSLKVLEAVNTPRWLYICSFQESNHGFND